MFLVGKLLLPLSIAALNVVKAQLPPVPQYDEAVRGKLGDGFKVSWKQNSVCEATPGVKSFSGYITSPQSYQSNMTLNSFFWFFESRSDPANDPFVIWVGGGPGFSSISSAVGENGPCIVNADSNSTTLNPWSFNNNANLIYIDQPIFDGFSYDTFVNGTVDQLSNPILAKPLPAGSPLPQANDTLNVGAFPSQSLSGTSNSTENAAIIFWQNIQTWFDAFPQYMPRSKRLNFWTESYGGRFGPLFIQHFQRQNELIMQGKIENAQVIDFDTLGINNGWIEPTLHIASYPEYAINNTYGIKLVNESVADLMISNSTMPGGCFDMIQQCRAAAAVSDSQDIASNQTVDALCASALANCIVIQEAPIVESMRNAEDIVQSAIAFVPPPFYIGFFAQEWVQRALGAAVNFTDNSGPVLQAFEGTGDLVRGGQLEALGALLDSGVRVALTNGDRDYKVNWFGGEAASLAIRWSACGTFAAGGYAPLVTNASYTGGLVRQAGRLAFARIFQAGHEAGYFQPETMFRVLQRSLAHLDLPEGKVVVDMKDNLTSRTVGPADIRDVRQAPPLPVKQFCYALSAPLTCSLEQLELMASGKAVFEDYILQDNSTGMH